MKRDERLYLNDLSKKVFGTTSRWKKSLDRGVLQTMTRTLEDGTEQKYKGIKYGTLEEAKKELEFLWEEKQKENKKVDKKIEEVGT